MSVEKSKNSNSPKGTRGGARPNAGRKQGKANTKTREIADKASAEGITPLEYMLGVLRREPAQELVKLATTDAPATMDDDELEKYRAKQNKARYELAAIEAARFEAAKQAAPYMHPKLANVQSNVELQGRFTFKLVNEFEN